MNTCGAKTRSGEPCKLAPVTGRTRCRMHGGRSPRGAAHPSTTSGIRSLDFPTRLGATYRAALADPDLVTLRGEAALLEARLVDLLGRVDTGEAGAIWQELGRAAAEFTRASRAADSVAALTAAREMVALATRGEEDRLTWTDVLRTVDALRRVKDSERKRIESAHNVLTVDRAMLLVGALTDAVRRHVSDRQTLDAIGREIARLVDVGPAGNGALDDPRGAG